MTNRQTDNETWKQIGKYVIGKWIAWQTTIRITDQMEKLVNWQLGN